MARAWPNELPSQRERGEKGERGEEEGREEEEEEVSSRRRESHTPKASATSINVSEGNRERKKYISKMILFLIKNTYFFDF